MDCEAGNKNAEALMSRCAEVQDVFSADGRGCRVCIMGPPSMYRGDKDKNLATFREGAPEMSGDHKWSCREV